MSKSYDLSTIGGRLGHAAQLVGGPTELARRADISQPTISRIVQGRETTVSVMMKIYAVLQPKGVTLDWLLLGEGNPDDFMPKPEEEQEKTGPGVSLKVFDDDQVSDEAPIYFDETWFKATVSRYPHRCYAFRAADDELRGIRKGSWTVIDTSVIYGDGIYLIEMSGAVLIRQIQFMPTGEIKIRSHSDAFEDFTLTPDQKDLIKVIGRMVWWEAH